MIFEKFCVGEKYATILGSVLMAIKVVAQGKRAILAETKSGLGLIH